MRVEAYLVPPGLKNAKNDIFKKALNGLSGDYSKAFYVTPTRHMLDGFMNAFHGRIAEGKCYIPPRLTTLNELAMGISSTYGGSAVLGRPLIPPLIAGLFGSGMAGSSMGMANLTADFIRELKNHYPSMAPESVIKILDDVLAELDIHEEVKARVMDALRAFAAYEEGIRGRALIDVDDALPSAARLIHNLNIGVLLLDGFYEVTRAEELLIGGLIEQAEKTVITIPVSDVDDDLSHCYCHFLKERFGIEHAMLSPANKYVPRHRHAAASMEEELEGIARHIKSSYLAGRLDDLEEVFIVLPALAPYREMLGRVLGRYGIPFQMRPSVKRPSLDLLALLESVSEDYPRLSFSRVLTSPYFKDPDMETLRPIVSGISLSGVIKGKDSWLNAFKEEGSLYHKAGIRLFKKITPLKNIGASETYGTFIKALLDILEALSFDPSDEGELKGLLRGLGILDGIGSGMALKGLIEALKQAITHGGGRMEGKSGVTVMELFEARGLEPGFLYFAGLRDGDIPARPEMDFLLPEQVRHRLGLRDTTRYLHLQGRIFGRLVSASGGAYLSYPTMEGDKFFLPSIFISGMEEIRERPIGVFSEEERMLRKGAGSAMPLSGHIRQAAGIRKYTGKSYIRVTDIDHYRRCPRRFLLEKVFGLEPAEIKDYEVEAETIGIVVHEVMERIMDKYDEDPALFIIKVEPLLDEVLHKRPLDSYFRALIRESFLGILPAIHELERKIRGRGLHFHSAEVPVEGEPLEGIRLRGKIDRIDKTDEGALAVIDYKTGSAYLSGSGVLKRGESLQLFLYAALLKSTGMRPAYVGIYSLKDLDIYWVPGKRDKRGLDDYIEAALRHLDDTIKAMRKGDFNAAPLSEQTCRRCYERPYCPYIQKGKSGEINPDAGR